MTNNQTGGPGDENKSKNLSINSMILNSMKSRSGRETTKWINNLTREGMKEIEDAASAPIAQSGLPAQFAHPSIAQTQVKWVDRLFDIFQQYEVEFNRACQIAELRVTSERPAFSPEQIAKLQSNDQHHYTGRLHTRFWSLALRGNLSHIEGYIIQSDHFIGFENNVSNHRKLFEFLPVWDGELRWSFDRGSISINQLPSMAKLIFGHLINVAKGDIDLDAPFSYGLSATVAGPRINQPWQAGNEVSDYLKNHTGVFEDDKAPLASEDREQGRISSRKIPLNPNAAVTSEAPQLQSGSNSGTFNKGSFTPTSSSSFTSATAAPVSSPASASAGSSNALTGGSSNYDDLNMTMACDLLGKAISKELDMLSRAGSKAFENHDFAEVEKLMKRTAKVKGLRDEMFAAITEWKKQLGEE